MKRHEVRKENGSYCVLLHRSEIVYDVELATWALTKTHFVSVKGAQTEDNLEQVLEDAQDSVIDERMSDWIDRKVKAAVSMVKSTISPMVVQYSRIASDEILDTPLQWHIQLHFDGNWRGDVQTLCDFIHEYVTNKVTYEWCVLKFPSTAPTIMAQADASLRDVRAEAYKMGPVSAGWTL